jgi:hypothetical protein
MPFKYLLVSVLLIIAKNGFSQTSKKSVTAKFTNEKIIIDGKLNEAIWKNTDIASDFVYLFPENGKDVPKNLDTQVKVLYDNTAIYIGAYLKDDEPNKITKELTQRDNFATAEHFGALINGFNDGQQDFRFYVSSAGVQIDVLHTDNDGEDDTWNAIWESSVKIVNDGWIVEMKIPYAALRFPKSDVQTWGINFYREHQRERQTFTWSRIDNKINSETNQAGILNGIQNITTPTRLFFIPYTSSYLSSSKTQKTKAQIKGGLDIKYGINDAFTLDAILIPDFGQTAFDNVILNLGPFEQQFQENRPFFTEGTELFSKGDLVYSRRIGGEPALDYNSFQNLIGPEKEITEFPEKVNLLNALKVSGRTKGGLGIGILNAITEKTNAKIKDSTTQETSEQTLEPLANYNILVLDQRFNQNSSVTLINTNVTRNGTFRDANVTGALFDLNTKANTYNLSGDFKYSYINDFFDLENKKGINTSIYAAETSGKFRYGGGAKYVSTNWDNNDLGINFQTHYHAVYSNASFRILKPTKFFNSFSIYNNIYTEFDNRTGRVQSASINLNNNFTTKKNDYFNYGFSSTPIKTYDFYEARSFNQSKFLTIPKSINFFTYISTNYTRKFAIDFNPSYGFHDQYKRVNYGILIIPRYRFSDKISLIYALNFSRQNNNIGYIDSDPITDEVFIARRNRITYINTIIGKYTLNSDMNLALSVRHYWSYADNNQIYTLQDNGDLLTNSTYLLNKNSNFTSWNLDLSYSWWFAPGSQISVLYRNNSAIFQREFERDFRSNLTGNLNNENLNHILSFSIRYFIDYNNLKRKKQ